MARGFHPAIEELARKRRLGTPEQLYTQLDSVLLLSGLLVFFTLFDVFFNITLFTNPGTFQGDPAFFEVMVLGIIALCIYGIGYVRSPPTTAAAPRGFSNSIEATHQK